MRVLIANRGEIAVRIIRACREMGLSTIAVYSDCDRDARHVRDADTAVHIGPNDARSSYLDIDAIIGRREGGPRRCGAPGIRVPCRECRFRRRVRRRRADVHRTVS